MQQLEAYINSFIAQGDRRFALLAKNLAKVRAHWDTHTGGNAQSAFGRFVATYNWLGDPKNKAKFDITGNLSRNLTGALMQDYLIHLVIQLLQPYPALEVLTEVPVPFGTYPLWEGGSIVHSVPSQRVDLAVGYIFQGGEQLVPIDPWPRLVLSRLESGQFVLPVLVINSKIRVSQSEFFDWLGREELLTKGNPHCLSLQVALRSEMDLRIVQAAQASGGFFLLGRGRETNVVGDPGELAKLAATISEHLAERM